MWSTLAAAAALTSPSNIDFDQLVVGQDASLLAVAYHQENNNTQTGRSGSSALTQESIDDLIRRASPINGVADRLKLEERYRDVESRALVNGEKTYVFDPRPKFAALNVASFTASRDGRYIAISQLSRIDQEELISGALPTYRLDLSVLDRASNRLTALKLPPQTIQSDESSPQAIERLMLNDIAFFSGNDARGRMLVLLVDRNNANKLPQRIAWSASPDGSCVQIGPVGWKDEISLNPNSAVGISYSVDKLAFKTQRTIFSPDKILQQGVIDGEVFPYGWTARGYAIEGSARPGEPRSWWTINLSDPSLKPISAAERPLDVTPSGAQFSDLPLSTKAATLTLNSSDNNKDANRSAASIRLDHEFQTSTVLPAFAKTPLQVFGLVQDGSAFLSNVFEVPTKLFQQRLMALKERDQLEERAQEMADAVKKIVGENKGVLPSAQDLLSALGAQGVSTSGFKILYDGATSVQNGARIAEMKGQYWVAIFVLGGTPFLERLSQ